MRLGPWFLASCCLFACAGDDGASSAAATSSTTSGTTSSTATTGSEVTGSTATSESSTGTTTSGPGETSSSTTGTATGTATDTATDTEDPGLECDGLVAGPLEPVEVSVAFDGSEDLAFDGVSLLVGKRGEELLTVDSDGVEAVLADGIPKAYGLRYRSDGDLIVALPNDGRLIAVGPGGEVSDLAVGLQGPNGVYVDLMDRVWVTEFGGSKVIRVESDATITPIVSGAEAEAANGVVYDPTRDMLFYTNYQAGLVRSVGFDGGAPEAPVVLGSIDGKPDGLVLDACGNLYIVDQGGSRIYRLMLDAEGEALGEPTLLAEFPANVANAQFGGGGGFDTNSLYVAGNPGVVYRIDVMVAGAAVPTVP